MSDQQFVVPQHLVDSFRKGNVIAFVGAGFSSAAGFPTWKNLLLDIATDGSKNGLINKDIHDTVVHLLRAPSPSAHDLDQAAQLLDDGLNDPTTPRQTEMVKSIRKFLSPKHFPLASVMDRRLQILRELPFKAILTTNFNPLFRGRTPFDKDVADYYRSVLRGERLAETGSYISSNDGETLPSATTQISYKPSSCPIIQIHGNLDSPESVVLTREGYRNLLYACPNYNTFLKSCLSTHTMLYIGVSFSDAYLNELRSEIMGLFRHQAHQDPLAYSILNDRVEMEKEFFLRHEGMGVLSFNTNEHKDWTGFDTWLEAIHTAVLTQSGKN